MTRFRLLSGDIEPFAWRLVLFELAAAFVGVACLVAYETPAPSLGRDVVYRMVVNATWTVLITVLTTSALLSTVVGLLRRESSAPHIWYLDWIFLSLVGSSSFLRFVFRENTRAEQSFLAFVGELTGLAIFAVMTVYAVQASYRVVQGKKGRGATDLRNH
jgi:hypothetical protein